MARDNYQRGTGRGHRPERRISIRGVRREEPDLRKLAQALIALAQAQAEADAEAQTKTAQANSKPESTGLPPGGDSSEAA